jgi:hypothetical protein
MVLKAMFLKDHPDPPGRRELSKLLKLFELSFFINPNFKIHLSPWRDRG